MSESQERMMAIVEPSKVEEFMAVCEKWDVIATTIGEVTDTGRLRMKWHGELIVDVPPRTLAHEGPVYNRPFARPSWQDALQADAPTAERLTRPSNPDELRATLLRMIGSPNLADKTFVVEQYDHRVQGNTVLGHGEDSGMVRLDAMLPGTNLGVALSTDGNGRFTKLDPYAGAQLALAEAYRNVATTGAKPLAVTDCLNFGSPEDPDVMWQFAEACRGLADACLELGVPVTGGNVSFYNQTGDVNINPTPVVGVLGVIDDVTRRTRSAFAEVGDILLLVGDTRDEFGGSEWAHEVHGHLGGLPPRVDLNRERVLGEVLIAGSRDGMFSAAHDLSDGGLAQSVVESCLRGSGNGASLVLPETDADGNPLDPFVGLFSESAGRAVVAVPRTEELRFTDMCKARQLPVVRVGVVGGDVLEVQGQFTVPLNELREAHTRTFPALFGH
jgi:phosphoribosylformylglycinamidine synthase